MIDFYNFKLSLLFILFFQNIPKFYQNFVLMNLILYTEWVIKISFFQIDGFDFELDLEFGLGEAVFFV